MRVSCARLGVGWLVSPGELVLLLSGHAPDMAGCRSITDLADIMPAR